MDKYRHFISRWFSFSILRSSTRDILAEFRVLERLILKVVRSQSHLNFNETCINNNLLPTYTNVKLHDGAASSETFVVNFRLKLVQRQVEHHRTELLSLKSQYEEKLNNFRSLIDSPLRTDAYLTLLSRISRRKVDELNEVQRGKLYRLYGSPILLKQNVDSVVNLSSAVIDKDIQEILSYGMNCHLKHKFNHTMKKVQVELLYDDIKDKAKDKHVIIHNEEELKSDLETFGMRKNDDFTSDILSKSQYQKIKNFNNNDSIVTRKADKSSVFVILDKSYYVDGIRDCLADQAKFIKIRKDPTEDLKRELNRLISEINSNSDTIKFQKLQGKYEPGYIYANPKIHKRLVNPPLRPIISQVGTVTYNISKKLNSIVSKYMPRRYTVKSSYEFISMLKSNNPGDNILASLDVENLFTNVPVDETIEIIINNVYNHPTLTPPDISADILRQLLRICTTRTPFRSVDGDLYVQRDGVSMGSALGPCFADFYMCQLENRVFDECPNLKPTVYARYVDDCFLLVRDLETVDSIRSKFISMSVLNFTFELEKSRQLPFLDILVNRSSNSFNTSVYVKSTNLGQCINYKSICPDRYKTGVIKTFLHRAYNVCSNWSNFSSELERIKQILSNNNFPMTVIDNTIKKFLDNKFKPSENPAQIDHKIVFYYKSQMQSNYKLEEKRLQNIFSKNVSPATDRTDISLRIYYKNRKLQNLFIRNRPKLDTPTIERSHVVYQYTCDQDGCNSSKTYIGYTTCTLSDRFRMHAQQGSIKKHLQQAHQFQKIPKQMILAPTKILATCQNRRELFYTEAIYIKDLKPVLNAQDEGADRLLKVFKH